jgi:hypothetical protein
VLNRHLRPGAVGRAVARDSPWAKSGGHPAIMADVEEVEVVVAHHERVTLRAATCS